MSRAYARRSLRLRGALSWVGLRGVDLRAEQTPLNAYLGGFTLVQLAVAVLASDAARLMKVRLAGATVAGIGLVLFVGHVEGVLSGHPVTTAAVKGDSSSTSRSFTASGEGMWHARSTSKWRRTAK